MNVRELHSRKPQLYRTRISDEFRESKRLILVSSDVSARGMNYPDVTLVTQVCIKLEILIHDLHMYATSNVLLTLHPLATSLPLNRYAHPKIMCIFTFCGRMILGKQGMCVLTNILGVPMSSSLHSLIFNDYGNISILCTIFNMPSFVLYRI